MHRHRRALIVTTACGAAAAAAGLLGGCAGLVGPRTVVFSEADLQALLARRFPLDRRLMEVMEVQISEPHLGLLPQQNRLSAELTVAANDRLFATRLRGQLSLTTSLRVEPSDRSLRLKDVRVTQLTLDKLGEAASERGQRLGTLIVERLLEDTTIHQFRVEQWDRLMSAGYAPPTVAVTTRGLELTAAPAR